MFIEFHRNLLADRLRNEAFYRALQHVVQPGKSTVADLGSGTGFLGFLALKLGAKAVYFYEYSPALKLSQKLARANGLRGCHFIQEHSSQVADPTPVDIIISETLGNYAYEENIIENLEDAKRFLKPQGILIPQGIEQFVAPVISARFHQELTRWDEVAYGLNFALAKEMSLNNLYVRSFTAADLLDGGQSARRWDAADLTKKCKSLRHGQAHWNFTQEAAIYGFAVWWECRLVADIHLGTSPLSARTHWEQLYFPALESLYAEPGDQLTLNLYSDTRYQVGVNVRWDILLKTKQGKEIRQALDMKRGDLT